MFIPLERIGTVSIKGWCWDMDDKVKNFQEYWNKRNIEDPANWPLFLCEGDLDEQFDIYCESIYPGEKVLKSREKLGL